MKNTVIHEYFGFSRGPTNSSKLRFEVHTHPKPKFEVHTQPNSSKLIHDTSTSFVLIDTQNTSLRCCGISSVLVSNLFGFEGMLSIMDKTDNNFGKAPVLLVPGVIIKIIKSQK